MRDIADLNKPTTPAFRATISPEARKMLDVVSACHGDAIIRQYLNDRDNAAHAARCEARHRQNG